jgi:hypothetical protein
VPDHAILERVAEHPGRSRGRLPPIAAGTARAASVASIPASFEPRPAERLSPLINPTRRAVASTSRLTTQRATLRRSTSRSPTSAGSIVEPHLRDSPSGPRSNATGFDQAFLSTYKSLGYGYKLTAAITMLLVAAAVAGTIHQVAWAAESQTPTFVPQGGFGGWVTEGATMNGPPAMRVGVAA